jgi:hypothetical protein
MSITAVLAAVTCHSAYGQVDAIGSAAQGAAGQIGSAANSPTSPLQSPSGGVQANADTNTQAVGDVGANTGVGANANTGVGANANTDVDANANTNANAGVSGVDGQADVNASNSDLNTAGQAGANASTQNQINRGDRNLNRGVNRGTGVLGGILPPIPQQALSGNSGPYDARWRFAQRNGQWWYYSPQNRWMVRENDQWQNYDDSYQPLAGGNADQGQYRSGFRGNMSNQGQGMPNQGQNQGQYGDSSAGQMQMTAHTGPVYMLRYDHSGREFICVHGQRVYFDNQQSMRAEPMSNDRSDDERYESARRNLDATDSEDRRPLPEPQSDGANGESETATVPPPAPTADSSDGASDAAGASDADNTSDDDKDGEEAEGASDDDSEGKSDADEPEDDEADSDEA